VLRRRALEAVAGDGEDGPWAEHFFCFWEDLELGWRLTRAGWPIVSLPEAVAVHTRGAGAAPGRGPLRWRRPAELEACILSNRWMTLMRHLSLHDLIPRLPVLLAWDAAAVLVGVVRRPRLARLLLGRLPLIRQEWRRRRQGLDRLPRLPVLLVWDPGMVVVGALRRPAFARALGRRWPLVVGEWRDRRRYPRRRLRELTCRYD
jgi:hypothetical protein